jgi:hypothetical protein
MVRIFPKGELAGVVEALREIERDTTVKLEQMANYIGIRAIVTCKSLTDETRPPARKANGEWTGWRKAHPGHWGDVSNQLVNSYGWDVTARPGLVELILSNTAEYAEKLERRDNFWVLEGVTAPGGPVDQAFRQAILALAPDWKYDLGVLRETRA